MINEYIRKSLITIILLSYVTVSFAQINNIHFEQISLERGLSQSTVYCILQDKQGYMWIGTEDGLNRYDGYGFKVYNQEFDHPTG